jgi:dGTPase
MAIKEPSRAAHPERWQQLLNSERRKKEHEARPDVPGSTGDDTRTEIERDHDRILFSTPVRRLADKTQVFPLEKNDSVRTRLTHSHEVSNLARSFGTALAFRHKLASDVPDSQRNVPALLAAIGLVHDLGNPPFGHQGEAAIQSWFEDHRAAVLEDPSLTPQHVQDFTRFEGNAQGFRLVTRLQLLNDDFGLDLTYATLAGMLKYPVGSDGVGKSRAATKKHGFFAAEQDIAKRVLARTGLSLGVRHPLAYVMEACDDIAYVVLDAEDAVKKSLASFSDLMAALRHDAADDPTVLDVVERSCEKHRHYRETSDLSPAELNDVSMQRFRVFAIGALVRAAIDAFVQRQAEIERGELTTSLLEASSGERLRKALKAFGFKHAYRHRSVLKVELSGHNVIHSLMDIFWDSIVNRENPDNPDSERVHPYSRFVYGRISENYRRVFEKPLGDSGTLPIRYRECLLLTDMISGMTDSFAVSLNEELQALQGGYCLRGLGTT